MMTRYLNNRRQANSKGNVVRGKKAKQKQDEGLALVIALLTGMMPIVGTTGLLCVNSRKKTWSSGKLSANGRNSCKQWA